MKHLDYEVTSYQTDQREQVVELLGQLLDGDAVANDAYFEWKYEKNPHAQDLLGIVAKYRGKIIGFRGYGSSLWHHGMGKETRALIPGDTCVDLDHRKKGLSVAMGKFARAEYAATYPLLLNLSCTRDSLPGYLRLGFAPITNKVYLSRYSLPGLARYIRDSKKKLPLSDARYTCGRFGNVRVSDKAEPEQMASVIARQVAEPGRFRLCQDADYFRWRLSGPADRFVFYYLENKGDTVAYVVLSIAPGNQRAYILDYADIDGVSSGRLLEFIATQKSFSVLSIFSHSVDSRLAPCIPRLGFHAGGIMGALEKKVRGNMPLLLRPVTAKPDDSDWHVGGVDVRDPGNWSIKGICSDAT